MFAKQTKSPHAPASPGVSGTTSQRAPKRPKANAFPKSARLLKHASFQEVYERGRKHFSANMIFFYVLKTSKEKSSVEIGLTVGRALGGAVDRNRIKRRMRDLVRHNLGTLRETLSPRGISAEVVINPKKAALTAGMATLRAEVARGFALIAQAAPAAADPSGAAISR